MKPDFPSLIITPRTPHRILRTTGAEGFMDKLREHDVNASAFLMDADLLAKAEGFQNDGDIAITDLLDQLPEGVAKAVLGDKKDDDDGGNGGGGSGGGGSGGSGDDDDGDDSPMDQGMSMPAPGHESASRKRQRDEEERRRREEQEHGMGM